MKTHPQRNGAFWTIAHPAIEVCHLLYRYRRVLASVTKVELLKRYSGSVLGKAWVFIYPVLLLVVYLFVFLIVFKARLPGLSAFEYVLYVFCGLIPFIGVSEALNAGCVSLRQNMHLIKNVMLPIELVPVRTVFVSLASQLVGTSMVIVMLVASGLLSWQIVLLPLVLLMQCFFLIGLILILSALAVALPDVSYFVGLTVMLLMFLSPIGFRPDMVPPSLGFLVYLNPVHYLIAVYRSTLMAGQTASMGEIGIFSAICLFSFLAGSVFFRRFKSILVDYE